MQRSRYRRCWAATCGLVVATFLVAVAADVHSAETVSTDLDRIFSGRAPKNIRELREMEAHVQKLAAKVTKATVHVRLGPAHGSGVIVSANGTILTAAHVAGRPGQEAKVILADKREVRGVSLGLHFRLDAGMIRISEPGTWPYLEMAGPQTHSTGEWCAATGHPGGYDRNRSPVFRLGRILAHGDNKLIRTDCQLIGGDSGGPLVDMYGAVIGIHSRIGSNLANNQHVPISAYLDHWDRLVSGDTLGLDDDANSPRSGAPWMGVKAIDGETSTKVSSVARDSPADHAGVRIGDTITHFDGQPIGSFVELSKFVRLHKPGDRVSLRVRRNAETISLRVTLGRKDL